MTPALESAFSAFATSDSHTTCLSRSLAGSVVLPNVSPLTDRKKLKPTIGIENIGNDLASSGFGVGWSEGHIQVTSPDGYFTRRGGLDSLVPPRTPPRARTASTISFRNYTNKDAFSNRPHTSPALEGTSGGGGNRFSSLGGRSAGSSPSRPPPAGPLHNRPFTTSTSRLGVDPQTDLPVIGAAPHDTLSSLLSPRVRLNNIRGQQHGFSSRPQPADVLTLSPEVAAAVTTSAAPQLDDPLGVTGSVGPVGASAAAPAPVAASGKSAGRGVKTLEMNVTQPVSALPTGRYGDKSGVTHLQRTRQTHPMAAFKPSRGHALIVFNEMDLDKNGKLTRSEFEDAAVKLGFNMDQINRVFSKLDKRRRGFLQATDWGDNEAGSLVQSFTLMYMQRFMGLPDITASADQVQRYFKREQMREVKSLPAAINLVRVNALTRGSNMSSGSGDAIFDSFRFIDTDGSGALSKEELRDAFFALGVFLSDTVVGQIMDVFDRNGDGIVHYHEFVRAMFPATGRSLR